MKPADAMRRLAEADPLPGGVSAPALEPILRALDDPGPTPETLPRSRVGSRRPRGVASRLILAVMVGVTLAVAAGAVLFLHPTGQTANPPTLPAAQRGLVGILAVLREPQTAADRHPGPEFSQALGHLRAGRPDASLIRVAGVTPSGQKIVLVPMRPRDGTWPPRPVGPRHGLRLALFGGGVGCCLTPAAIEDGQAWSSSGDASGNYVVIVVPDGIARIRIAFARPIAVAVHHNVAVFATPRAVENLNVYAMTWYGKSDQIVKRIGSSLPPRPTHARAAAGRTRELLAARRANVHTSARIQQDFALFNAGTTGTFGVGPTRFTLTHPPLTALPTSLLATGSGGGYTKDLNNARVLTTHAGERLWLLAGRDICIYGPTNQNAVCTADPGATPRFGLTDLLAPAHGPGLLIAIVPRTNTTITLTTPTGRRTEPVHDGVAVATSTSVIRITFKNSTGQIISQPVPLRAASVTSDARPRCRFHETQQSRRSPSRRARRLLAAKSGCNGPARQPVAETTGVG